MARFAQILATLGGGNVANSLDDKLTEVVEAVHLNNKVGSITIKLKILPNGENGITIEEEIASKVPQPNRGKTLFFTDDNGNLLRNDPRQSDLFPKPVGGTGAVAEQEKENATA